MKKVLTFIIFSALFLLALGSSQCAAQERKFDVPGMFLKAFKIEATAAGVVIPDNLTIKYVKMGTDTTGAAHKVGNGWVININPDVHEYEIETIIYHCAAHACGLDTCEGHNLIAYGDMVRLTKRMKSRLFAQIVQFQKLCK